MMAETKQKAKTVSVFAFCFVVGLQRDISLCRGRCGGRGAPPLRGAQHLLRGVWQRSTSVAYAVLVCYGDIEGRGFFAEDFVDGGEGLLGGVAFVGKVRKVYVFQVFVVDV